MSQAQDTPLPAWENLTLPIIVHGLFLASLVAFPPAAIVGVILAHASVGAAGSSAASHFRFQVRTFWLGLAAWALAAIAMFWGGVFSMILIGIPLLVAAMLALGAVWLWAVVRSAVGLAWAVQGRPCPRPDSFTF